MTDRDPEEKTQQRIREEAQREGDDEVTRREEVELDRMEQRSEHRDLADNDE